ncbi:MAG: alpha/beta hydrolase [bacterium]|nr:alpha/beta hydrolase [bacterium]
MKKYLTRALVALAVTTIAVVASVATYPAIGGKLYAADMQIETALYGLHRAEVEGGDARLMTYQGGPAAPLGTVVMIHGYSADKDVWVRFARHFTSRYRVVIVDLPGHGDTPFDPALHYDTVSQAARVLRVMDVLGIRRAHLVGNSMGGFIAARMAHDHGDRVASATLMDAAGVISSLPSEMDRMVAAGRNPFEVSTQEDFRRFYGMTMAKAPWVPGATLDFIGARYIAQRAQLARIFRDFHHVGLLDDSLASIHVPVLVMWGAQDRLVHVSAAAKWAKGIPGARRVIYDDLGHMPMVEDPARSAHDVLAFIERNP